MIECGEETLVKEKKLKGTLMLLLAAMIWGTAFVAQTSAADSVEPFTFNAVRSLIGAAFLCVLIRWRGTHGQGVEYKTPEEKKYGLRAGIACGVLLFAAVNFQQFGLSSYPENVAASGRGGFLTASYVVLVALCARLTGRRLHPLVLLSALGCVAGLYLLCLSGGISGLYLGDGLMLICALFFTAHVLTIDHFSRADSVKTSCIQFLTCGVLSSVCALLFEHTSVSAIVSAWLPILYTGILSSGVAYTLQIVGQKDVEPAVASIVMSLEAVFSALAGWTILNERLSPRELFGCALVFCAVLLAQAPALLLKKQNQP